MKRLAGAIDRGIHANEQIIGNPIVRLDWMLVKYISHENVAMERSPLASRCLLKIISEGSFVKKDSFFSRISTSRNGHKNLN